MDREAECTVRAVRNSLRGTDQSALSRCEVIEGPLDLPEGKYLLTYDGQTVAVQKRNGFWLADMGN